MLKAILIIIIMSLHSHSGYAQEVDRAESAQKEAEKIHTVASSDILYSNEEVKALYYQNIQIIELLKEIRSLLSQQLYKPEEKIRNST